METDNDHGWNYCSYSTRNLNGDLAGSGPLFEHVTILLSFVYALALTHLLSSATDLAIAGKRVRFSGLYAAWAISAALLLFSNWISLWGLTGVKRWTTVEVLLQFLTAIIQYFTCSTFRVSMNNDDDTIDLPALYQRRRRLIFGAFLALGVMAMFVNWWDRNNMNGMGPNDWIVEDLTIIPIVITVILAGWARSTWLQWLAAVSMFGLNIYILVLYGVPGS